MQLFERIELALKKAGMIILPDNKQTPLVELGLDSLTLALLIIELDREFHLKIPVLPLQKEKFISIATIANYLSELGEQ